MLKTGLRDYGPSDREAFLKAIRELEAKLLEFGGIKGVYHKRTIPRSPGISTTAIGTTPYVGKENATYLQGVYDNIKVDVEAGTKAINSS